MRTLYLVGLLAAGLAWTASADDSDKGTKVTFDTLTSTTPASWEKQTPTGPFAAMRFAQFRIPRAKGDSEDGLMVISRGFGGTAKENLARWKGQFDPPEGKKIDDVAKVEEFKVAGCEVTYLDISGIYFDGPPMLPKKQKKQKPGFRMLAVQFEGPDKTYHILLRGPEKTIAEHKKGFEAWVKGFKK